MFNVTVLKMKDIKKYAMGIIIAIMLVIVVCKYFPQITKEKKAIQKVLVKNNMIGCLEKTVPAMSSINKQEVEIKNKEDWLQGILKTQISSIPVLENIEKKDETSNQEEIQNEEKQKLEEAKTGLNTQVITVNPIKENYNTEY